MKKPKNILICPLEWGLGHAARMIPVAQRLIESGHHVMIASGEMHLDLFRAELTGAEYIKFPGFSPGYSRFLPQYLALFFKTPLLIFHIIRDHNRLKKLIAEYSIEIVISDNRFGCWNKRVKSVYVTHMPRIPFPELLEFLELTGVLLHRYIIKKYTYCFIPDLPGDINLSGRLSHGIKLPPNTRYIGILSRFALKESSSGEYIFPHNTVILSGPEPQRSIFRKKIITALHNRSEKTVVLEGRPDRMKSVVMENVISYGHLPTGQFLELLRTSNGIVSRSGYTTIMDLVALGMNALLIPTPGQTEQEYLAKHMSSCGWFSSISQNSVSESVDLPGTEAGWTGILREKNEGLLERALYELLEGVQE